MFYDTIIKLEEKKILTVESLKELVIWVAQSERKHVSWPDVRFLSYVRGSDHCELLLATDVGISTRVYCAEAAAAEMARKCARPRDPCCPVQMSSSVPHLWNRVILGDLKH